MRTSRSLASLLVLVGATVMTGCGASEPQACKELRPAVESYESASKLYNSDRSQFNAQVFVSAQEELGRIALAVSDTSSAREEGISDSLRNFALAMSRFDEEGAAALAGVSAYSIEQVCGFSMFGEPTDSESE